MKTVLMTALFAALAAAPAGATELVANGGFETPGFDGWSRSHTGLIGAQEAGDVHAGADAALFGADPMILDGYPQTQDVLEQDLTTVAGQAYTFSYWLAVANTSGLPVISRFQSSYDGHEVPMLLNAASADYQQYSFDFVAGSASTALIFAGYSKFGYYKLDDVSLIAKASGPVNEIPGVTINPTAVPEPASWALMIVGLGLSGATVRSRRRMALSVA